jgi:hypothetical protein
MTSCVDVNKVEKLSLDLALSVIEMESYGIKCNYKEVLEKSKIVAGYNWVLRQGCELPSTYLNNINRILIKSNVPKH